TITDPKGNVTNSDYDAVGRQWRQTDPTVSVESNGGTPVNARPVTKTGYDSFDEPTQVADGNGNVTSSAYDGFGRLSTVTYPSYTPPGGTAIVPTDVYTYDALSNVKTHKDRRNNTTSYVYDMRSRLFQE